MKSKSHFSFRFFYIFIINLLFFLSFSSLAIIPKHLKDIGATKTYIGFFMNSSGIMLIFFVTVMNRMLEKLKRKHLLIMGFLLSLAAVAAMFFFYQNLALLLLFQFISGTAYALGFTLLFSYIYDILKPEKRRGGAALYGISGILASPLGSLLSEYVFNRFGPQYLFLLSACFFVASLLLMLFIKDQEPLKGISKSHNMISVFKNKGIAKAVYFALLLGGAQGVFVSFIPLASSLKLGQANISVFFIALALIAVVIRLLTYRSIDKIPSRVLFLIAFSAMFLAMFLLLFLNSFLLLFIIGLIYGIGHSLLFPTLSTRFVAWAREDEKIIFNNIFLAYYTGGLLLFPTVMGLGGDLISTDAIFACMSVILFSGIAISLFSLFKAR